MVGRLRHNNARDYEMFIAAWCDLVNCHLNPHRNPQTLPWTNLRDTYCNRARKNAMGQNIRAAMRYRPHSDATGCSSMQPGSKNLWIIAVNGIKILCKRWSPG